MSAQEHEDGGVEKGRGVKDDAVAFHHLVSASVDVSEAHVRGGLLSSK